MKAKKERIPQYDLMRAVAMFLVVYVHSSFMFNLTVESDSKQAGLYWFTTVLALACNGLFFMVSGKFNLAQATKLEVGGYRTFYLKKVIDLLLPIVFYALTFWVLRFIGIRLFGAWDGGVSFWDFGAFFEAAKELLTSSWWFVPTIFSLMIFTPFLGRMVSTLKRKEITMLLALLFGCTAIITFEKLLGFSVVLSKFLVPVVGIWVGYYILGYVIDKVKLSPEVLKKWYIAASTIIVAFGLIFILFPQVTISADGTLPIWNSVASAIFYPVVASALFLFFKNIKITSDRTKKIIEFVGNRAFGIYLIHFCFFFSYLQLLPEWLRGSDNAVFGIGKRIIITAIIYLASLAVATAVDLLIVNPIQKQLKSKLLKTRGVAYLIESLQGWATVFGARLSRKRS